MAIDDNATFRHPELAITMPREFPWEPSDFDIVGWGIEETDFRGSGFVMKMTLDETSPGYIGFHAIGGGAAMIGMDVLSRVDLKPANFADTSGNPVASKIYRVAKVILSQPHIEGYLLAGFMVANQEQWHHAHALAKALIARETLEKEDFEKIVGDGKRKKKSETPKGDDRPGKLPAKVAEGKKGSASKTKEAPATGVA